MEKKVGKNDYANLQNVIRILMWITSISGTLFLVWVIFILLIAGMYVPFPINIEIIMRYVLILMAILWSAIIISYFSQILGSIVWWAFSGGLLIIYMKYLYVSNLVHLPVVLYTSMGISLGLANFIGFFIRLKTRTYMKSSNDQ